jgi:hypothetical protein
VNTSCTGSIAIALAKGARAGHPQSVLHANNFEGQATRRKQAFTLKTPFDGGREQIPARHLGQTHSQPCSSDYNSCPAADACMLYKLNEQAVR